MRSLVGVLAASLAFAPAQQQATPVFRARVDLVTVDVAVVDEDGKPVEVLGPNDFSIIAGQRPRRVLSADYVTVAPGRVGLPTFGGPPLVLPTATTNSRPPTGRTFMIVVDVDHMRPGSGRVAFKALGDYLDRLNPEDRVGLVTAPWNTPRVDLTTNRQRVKDTLATITGAQTRPQEIIMTVGEAAAIERLDSAALNEYLDRIRAGCNDKPPELAGLLPAADDTPSSPTVSCLLRWQTMATKVMNVERHKTQALFDTLRSLAAAMAPIEGPKSLILVSEGVVNDTETTADLRRFAEAAERSLVTMYGVQLDAPLSDNSSRYIMTTATVRDQQTLLDGMSTLAIAGRGDTFMVSGTPTSAFSRIDAEMSGYYLLSFEREPADRDGDRERIEVNVKRPGAIVRARKEFTAGKALDAPRGPVKDLKAAIGELLRWPVPSMELGVDLDTYVSPATGDAAGVRTVLAASVASAGRSVSAVGYEVANEAGKIIADGFEPGGVSGAVVKTERLVGDRQLYLSGLSLVPGRYRIKFAAIDADGRRGSVEHTFDVNPGRLGALRMSDVFLGEIAATRFLPNPWLVPGTTALPLSVELWGDTADALVGSRVTLELARPGAPVFAALPLSLKETAEPVRRVASATLAIGSLTPGEYMATAILQTPDGQTLRRSRVFVKR